MMTNEKRKQNWLDNKNKEGNSPVRARPGATNNNLPLYPVSYLTPLSNFLHDMDRVFDDTLRNFGLPTISDNFFAMQNIFIPNVDIVSNDNEYTIKVEVPGMEEQDIKLNISRDGMLIISGEKRQESTNNDQDIECSECAYGSFERALSLPSDIDNEAIEANFKNGILTIACPRVKESGSQTRQIPINSNSRQNPRSGNFERGVSGAERGADKNENQGSKRVA
jgi:HSP20 family protein